MWGIASVVRPSSSVSAPRPAKMNHSRFARASTISARSVPPRSRPIATKVAVPIAMTTAPSSSPTGCGRHPSAPPIAPMTAACSTTTVTTANALPAMIPHTGKAVAPRRFRAP
ncbi:Uncharacterised protein [Mycobacteroides abscessus subsp. abscessus]|nr:Uncharacterised protein [Mycobacteroides abscessus subsp. abscessus]